MLAAVQYPGLLCATGWGSLCPLDKARICGSAYGNPPASCWNPKGNFFFVTNKKQTTKTQEIKNEKDKGTVT